MGGRASTLSSALVPTMMILLDVPVTVCDQLMDETSVLSAAPVFDVASNAIAISGRLS